MFTRFLSRGNGKFVLLLAVIISVVVVAIEWSRRAGFEPMPPADSFASRMPPASSAPVSPLFPLELRDATGETLVIAAKPERIVSQTLATDEILLAICSPERIVALSSLAEDGNYSNVVEQAGKVRSRTTQGAEQILQLQPDLIFVASYSRAEVVRLFKASHAPVFRFANFNSIDDVKKNIRTVGRAIGNDAEADALIKKMDASLAAVKARIPGPPAKRVMSFGKSGYTAGNDTTFDDVLRAAGAINVSAENGIQGHVKISAEKVLEWQPDWIVTGANHSELESVRKNLLADPIIAASRAGNAGQVIVMDNRHFLTVSQFIVDGVEDLANALHGKSN